MNTVSEYRNHIESLRLRSLARKAKAPVFSHAPSGTPVCRWCLEPLDVQHTAPMQCDCND